MRQHAASTLLTASLFVAIQGSSSAQTPATSAIAADFQAAREAYATQHLAEALAALAKTAGAVDEAKATAPPSPARDPGALVRVGVDIPAPHRVKGEPARYSVDAARAGVVGLVIVDFTIAEDGKVRDPHVVKSIPMLDDRAVDAIRKWEYEPPRVGGKPTEATMEVVVNFTFRREAQIGDEIDLARFYSEQRRFDDAARLIAEATAATRDEALWFGEEPSALEIGKARPADAQPADEIVPPRKTRDVRPTYPQVAISVRVEGTVVVESLIDPTGKVVHTRVIRSVPLLDQSAVDAVSHWEFTPCLKNGVPTKVLMTSTVNFQLK